MAWYSCLENPQEQRSLAGYSSWGHKELDMTEWLSTALPSSFFQDFLIVFDFWQLDFTFFFFFLYRYLWFYSTWSSLTSWIFRFTMSFIKIRHAIISLISFLPISLFLEVPQFLCSFIGWCPTIVLGFIFLHLFFFRVLQFDNFNYPFFKFADTSAWSCLIWNHWCEFFILIIVIFSSRIFLFS